MRLSTPLAKIWPALLAGGLALGALALLWRVRDTPLALGAFARFDALSAFFLFALFGGIALALAARPTSFSPRWLRPAAAAGALALAYSTTLTLVIACAYLALALLTLDWQALALPEEDRPATPANRAMRALRRAVLVAPSLLAAGCLLLGYGALALRGAARYDDRTAGAALDSFAFWFVLLAALIACAPLFRATTDEPSTEENMHSTQAPLARHPHSGGVLRPNRIFSFRLALPAGAIVQPGAVEQRLVVRDAAAGRRAGAVVRLLGAGAAGCRAPATPAYNRSIWRWRWPALG